MRRFISSIILGTFCSLASAAEAQRIFTDDEVVAGIRTALQAQHHNIRSAQIIDGRLKGGDKGILLSYVTRAGTETEQLTELMEIAGSGWVASSQLGAHVDSTAVVVGDAAGRALAMMVVKTDDTARFIQGHDAPSYLKSWKITLLDPAFLSATGKTFGWEVLLVNPHSQAPSPQPEELDSPSFIWCYRTVGRDSGLFDNCLKVQRASAERIAKLTVHPAILDYCQRLKDGVPSLIEDCIESHTKLDDLTEILKGPR